MRARLVTLAAGVLLLLCAAWWVRSYLPEHSAVRAHRGSLYVVFYGQHLAFFIDPANHPTSEYAQPPTRWGTSDLLNLARSPGVPGAPGVKWRRAGFEVVAEGRWAEWGLLVLGVPFWALSLVPAAAAAWGAAAWRRERLWRATGRCRECGYDLRGSAGACPECGAPPGGGPGR